MANTPTDESRSHMSKLQSRIKSRLSLGNPEIHGCYGLVVGGATTYKEGMTIPESQSTPTASNHRTGSAGRNHLEAHLPAENRSWKLVNERTLEDITSRVNKRTWRRVNKQNDNVDTQTSDSEHTWRRSGSIPGGNPVSAPSNWR
jgi:hypothetical protein